MKDRISEDRVLLLHPNVRAEVKHLIELAESQIDQSLCIRIVQGLRTIDEQNALYAQGRTAAGAVVTNARGGQSLHNFGLAIDIAFLFKDANGDYQYDDKKSWLVGPNHRILQTVMNDNGWIWGGNWKTIKDTPHFEKGFGYSWKDLLARYNDGLIFEQNKIKYVTL